MAFGTPVAAAVAVSAQNGSSVSPAYPSGIETTDCLVLVVGQKPSTANGGTVTTPSGWTLREELTAAGGYGTTLGADTGNTNLRVYTKDTVTGSETGNLSVTLGTNNVAWAVISRVPSATTAFDYGSTNGSDTTGNAAVSIACAADPGVQGGDIIIAAMCIPTDGTTGFSGYGITQAGVTYGASGQLAFADSGTGNDIGGFVFYDDADSGTSSGVPTITATAAGTVTNVRGPGVFLRIRETFAAITGDLDATETGSDTFEATGTVPFAEIAGTLAATETGDDVFAATADLLVKGSVAAQEVGDDTFSATGFTIDAPITGTLAATETGDDSLSGTGVVIVAGSLSATETGEDSLSATGTVLVQGALAAQETGEDELAATGSVLVAGSFSVAETGVDSTGDYFESGYFNGYFEGGTYGVVLVQGGLSVFEQGADAFDAAGAAIASGSLSAQEEGSDSFESSGITTFPIGDLSAQEVGNDTFVADGNVVSGVIGDLACVELGADTANLSGNVVVSGPIDAVEIGSDTANGSVSVVVSAAIAAVESGSDTLQGLGGLLVSGLVAAAEAGDDLAALSGFVRWTPYCNPSDYWEFGYCDGDLLTGTAAGASTTIGAILGRLNLGGGATGSAVSTGQILRRWIAGATISASSSVSLTGRLQMYISVGPSALSGVSLSAKILWERQDTPEEAWAAQTDGAETWTDVVDGVGVWAEQSQPSDIWTEQVTGSETWT